MNQILLYRDKNNIVALIGPSLAEGTAGFGKTIPDALTDLIKQIYEEGIELELESYLETQ